MNIVYPRAGHQVFEDSVLILGSSEHPRARHVRVGDHTVPMSAGGCFSLKTPLNPGSNDILVVILSESGQIVESQSLRVERTPPYPVLPSLPLAVHEGTILPARETVVCPGDLLTVAVSASPNTQVFVTIPGVLPETMPLLPHAEDIETGPFVENRTGIFAELHQTTRPIHKRGYYRAQIPIPLHTPPVYGVPVTLHLQKGNQNFSKECPGRLSVWAQPRAACVATDRAITRTVPEGGARLTPQRKGTLLWLDGRQGPWWRARLSACRNFWLHVDDVKLLPGMSSLPATVDLIKTLPGENARQSLIWLPLRERVPLHIRGEVDGLRLSLYGAVSQCDFIHYHPGAAIVRSIECEQSVLQTVDVALKVSGLAGYDYAYTEDGLVLSVKTLPRSLPETRILIDAGHGGSESGGTACSGLPEKDLNLALSRLLAADLRERGFHVSETRTNDAEVSLSRRGELVIETGADLVISLHHNALPDGRDPGAHRGASTYYYHACSQPLARAIQRGLVSGPMAGYRLADYGVLYDSLYMTRIHQALAVLVEIGFMTHPEEYEYLINPAFQADVACSLARAIEDYCRAQS